MPQSHEEILQEFADNISDGLYCINTAGFFTFVNKALIERRGIQPEEFYTTHFLDLVDTSYRDIVSQNFQKVISGEKGEPYELRYKDAHGQTKIIEVHSKPIFKDGKVIGLLGISRDVTERTWAMEMLQRQEKYYRSLIENISDIVTVVNSDGIICDVSPSLERLLGYRNEQVIGVNAFHFIHPDDIKFTLHQLNNALKDASLRKSVEHRVRHCDGSWRIVESVGKVFRDIDKNVYVIVSSRDITDRKEAEQVLKTSEINLSRLVKEKVAQFIQKNKEMEMEIDDLKRVGSQLRKKNRELNVALVSHLRTKKDHLPE